jgi:hypothetical protein
MEKKIPLLTCYSTSHERLFRNYFHPTFLKLLSHDFELIIKGKSRQLCDGEFGSIGWNEQMKEKIEFVTDFLQNCNNEYLVFSDVDVVFFKNIRDRLLDELGDFDIAFQSDSGGSDVHSNLCCGFFICRVNDNTRSFFLKMMNNYNSEFSDQQNLNYFLKLDNRLHWKALPKEFFNFSFTTNLVWKFGDKIPYPDFPIILYHANFTIGTLNKEYLIYNFMARFDRIATNYRG